MNYAEPLTPVALYVRSSSLVEAEEAVEAQLTALRDYAERNRFHPVNHFVDTGGSREEFDWMMAQATSDNPPYRTILIYSYNRLSRSNSEITSLLAELSANGLTVTSITEPEAPFLEL